jgi:hypothetical protein
VIAGIRVPVTSTSGDTCDNSSRHCEVVAGVCTTAHWSWVRVNTLLIAWRQVTLIEHSLQAMGPYTSYCRHHIFRCDHSRDHRAVTAEGSYKPADAYRRRQSPTHSRNISRWRRQGGRLTRPAYRPWSELADSFSSRRLSVSVPASSLAALPVS